MPLPLSRTLCIPLALLVVCGKEPEQDSVSASPRPNIVLLLSDDQAVSTTSGEGHPWALTPSLDRLAADGVRFTQAFVTTSLCSPSRASFLTGRYARSHGILNNRSDLPRDLATYASVLSDAGYDSAYVGKWHMGRQGGARPGFAYTASYSHQGAYEDCTFEVGTPGDMHAETPAGWVDDVATDYALEFLRRERAAPFLLVLGFKGPHRPYQPPPRHAGSYAEIEPTSPANAEAYPPFPMLQEFKELARAAGVRQKDFEPRSDWLDATRERRPARWMGFSGDSEERLLDYHRVIRGLDDNLGRVRATLAELGLTEDTLLVYASDNGMCLGEHGLFGKRAAYEESIRIPLLISYPRLIEPGIEVDQTVLNIDLAPTLLDLAGAPPLPKAQGRSLRPLLEGRSPSPPWRESFVYEFTLDDLEFVPSYLPSHVALRTRDWKLIRYARHEGWTELYHLVEDALELNDLSRDSDHQERLGELIAQLEKDEELLDSGASPGVSSGD